MQRGFAKVAEKLPAVADKGHRPGSQNHRYDVALLGRWRQRTLYGTFFIRAAASSDACQSLTLGQLGKMLSDGWRDRLPRPRRAG